MQAASGESRWSGGVSCRWGQEVALGPTNSIRRSVVLEQESWTNDKKLFGWGCEVKMLQIREADRDETR